MPHWQLKRKGRDSAPYTVPQRPKSATEVHWQKIPSLYKHYELEFSTGKIMFSNAGRLGVLAHLGYEVTPDMVRDVMYNVYRKVSWAGSS